LAEIKLLTPKSVAFPARIRCGGLLLYYCYA
jgi:hypothetical protein